MLGKNGVNISRMQLGLQPESSEAVALYSIDKKLSPALLEELAQLSHIISIKQLDL